MAQHLHADCETFSEIDLRDVGAARYSNDPSTEILCCAFSLGDEEPYCWQHGKPIPQKYADALLDPEVLVYAHNCQFEMFIFIALSMKTWGIPCPDLSRFRCTMSFARRASLPAKLETLGEALGLENKKDNRGKALIKKFTMMQDAKKPTKKNPAGFPVRRIRPEDEPEAFAEFCNYCAQDVRAEQEVARRLAYFDSEPNNANYSLDAVINARGVPVNLVALRHAQKLIDEETEIVSAKFRELTGFNVTQDKCFKEWLALEGYPFSDLQAATIETFLDEWEDSTVIPPAVLALQLKQSVSYASIKKIPAMIACAGPFDNKVRGTLTHHGAGTGRWTASLIQPQNFKRATIKYSEYAYREICNGISREMLDICYGPPLEVISSCIRHFIHDIQPEDSML